MKRICDDRPWLQEQMIDWLNLHLKPDWHVIETGAGGSTVFFADRVKAVITFEHDPEWHQTVNQRLASRRLWGRVDLRLERGYPTEGLTNLDGFGEFGADLAFIDGRGRVKSIETVLPYIRPGGYLMLDDSWRARYTPGKMLADARAASSITFREFIAGGEGYDETTVWRLE